MAIKILVTDDEVFSRLKLKKLIREYDSDIQFYDINSGYDAYLMYQKVKPDIIFVDILEKGFVGGSWLIKKLIETNCKVDIVVISNQSMITLLQYKLMGATDCLRKPIDKNELYRILDNCYCNYHFKEGSKCEDGYERAAN